MNVDVGRQLYGLKRATVRPAAPSLVTGRRAHPCQACGSSVVHRDLARGWGERLLLPLLGLRAYRCVDCGHRFYDRPRPSKVSVNLKKGASPRLPELAGS